MRFADGVCSDCRKGDRGQAVELFSALNNMQPDEMLPMLVFILMLGFRHKARN